MPGETTFLGDFLMNGKNLVWNKMLCYGLVLSPYTSLIIKQNKTLLEEGTQIGLLLGLCRISVTIRGYISADIVNYPEFWGTCRKSASAPPLAL